MYETDREAPTCIDLRERFGDRFRITYDAAYDAKGRHHRDPWYALIPCRGNVTIYPFGWDLLAVEVDRHPGLAKQLSTIPGVTLHQAGDHERTYLFPAHLFDQVAAIVKPRRRRKLTPEQRQAAAERLARV